MSSFNKTAMKTELLSIRANPQQSIDRAVELLRSGELVAIPTETVYGLAACVFNPRQIQRIFEVKGRPQDNPLIAHIADEDQALQLCTQLDSRTRLCMQHFFPGPLTLVLEARKEVPSIVNAGRASIAFRMPDNESTRHIIRGCGQALVAPSANRSGRPSPTEAQHVLDDLNGTIAAVVDDGPCRIGLESTVLSLLDNQPRILRPGSVSKERIEEVLQCTVASADGDASEEIHAPGMKYRHYAPSIPVYCVENEVDVDVVPSSACILSWNELKSGKASRRLRPETFFAELRRAEAEKKSAIYILVDNDLEADVALLNRVRKAAGER